MAVLLIILIVLFVAISLVSFVISSNLDNKAKRNKEIWFNSHSESENKFIEDYIKFVRENKPVKVKKNEKKVK